MGIKVLEWVSVYGKWSQIMWNGFQSVWIEREADLETKYWPPSDSTVLLIHIPADRVSVGK